MTDLLLTTRLKVSDPTARTALATLRDRMGLSDRVASLVREELFLFDVAAPPAAAREVVEELARGTNLFLNPNKHAWRVRTGDELCARRRGEREGGYQRRAPNQEQPDGRRYSRSGSRHRRHGHWCRDRLRTAV